MPVVRSGPGRRQSIHRGGGSLLARSTRATILLGVLSAAAGALAAASPIDGADRARVASFARERKISCTIRLGDEAVGAAHGGVRFLPQTFFIGRDGEVVRRVSGLAKKSDLERPVRSLLLRAGGRHRAGVERFAVAVPSPIQPLPSYSMYFAVVSAAPRPK